MSIIKLSKQIADPRVAGRTVHKQIAVDSEGLHHAESKEHAERNDARHNQWSFIVHSSCRKASVSFSERVRMMGPLQQKVKSGEEWVKSARTLFTPRNADKHRGFGNSVLRLMIPVRLMRYWRLPTMRNRVVSRIASISMNRVVPCWMR